MESNQAAQNAWSGKLWRRVALACSLGLLISLSVFLLLKHQERQRDDAEFRRQIATYMGAFQEHRNGAEDVLRTLRALFFQDPNLSRQLFSNAVQDLSIRTSGMQAIGWAPRVSQAQRSQVEQSARAAGLPGFRIREGDLTLPSAGGASPAVERPEYFPLLFIVPMTGNETAVGYDLASHPAIRDLLSQTHAEGGAAVSGPLTLPYNRALKPGVMAAMPVYYPDFVPDSRDERLKQNRGYVVAVFIIDELLKTIAARAPDLRLDVMLVDATGPNAGAVMGLTLHGKPVPQVTATEVNSFRARSPLTNSVSIGGRRVSFEFGRSNSWDRGPGRWVPLAALCLGLLLTGFVAQVVHSSSARAGQVEAMVHVRTAQLAQANVRLKQEVDERIEAQRRLAQEHNLLQLLLNRLPDPVHVCDRQGLYVLANGAHLALLRQADPSSLLGRRVSEVGPSPLAQTLAAGSEELFESGQAVIGHESPVTLPDGDSMHLEVSKLPMRDAQGKVDGLLVISRDVTPLRRREAEQRELERRLQATQKLESLGVIAGGIAHDFNNLLTIILGNANIARLELPPDSNLRECLSRIESTSLRAADLCKQMLAYSGKGLFIIRRLDLNKLINELTELLHLSLGKNVNLQLQLTEPLPSVLADATQLQQILMNLVTNASEAIGERRGTIWIRSSLTQLARGTLMSNPVAMDVAEGEYILLEVADDGCGMTPEVREKIFDPFFSTKFTGRGLGLAAVLGIVRSHRGAIVVESEPGRGSTFKLFLPPVEGPPDSEGDSGGWVPDGSWKGQGTILLAEDEAGVRVTTADLLRSGGFSVEVVENGRSAIDKFRMAPDRYRAVLLDFAMPQGDGEEAFLEIRQIRPNAVILIMSGYGPQEVLARFRGKGLNGFIQKPFQAKDLMSALAKALHRDGQTAASPPSERP